MKILNNIILIVLKPQVFFLLVAFLLIQLWFSKGLLFGGTEAGIPTYIPGKTLGQIIWLWWEALGPGVSIPTVVASIPFYVFMSLLENLGLGSIGIQKIIFFIVLYLQGLGASLIFKTVIGKESRLQILAGLFYIFNPFMMNFVWHRFIYAYFILSATLPFFLYFYLKLIGTGKLKFTFLFLLTSFSASYMFSSIAPVITVWFSVMTCFITALILNRKSLQRVMRISILTGFLIVFWVFTNMWWIYSLFGTRTVLSAFSNKGNVDTLITISSQSTINNILRGINPYYMFYQKDWGNIYESGIFTFLSYISVVFILLGFIKRPNKQNIWYVLILFLVGVFFAKGAAEPLGKLTTWFYGNIFLLGAIRNPFEKLGLLVALPSAMLMTVGVNNFWNLSFNFLKKYRNFFPKFLITILVIGYGIYIWPMFSDRLFRSEKYTPFVKVPDDYQKVSEYLSKELEYDYGKILHLPISEGDSATYKWEYPYNGVELASHLFPGSNISRLLYIQSIDQLLVETARIFHTKNYSLQNYLLKNLDIKYIVLNKNLDWLKRNIDNPHYLEDILKTAPYLEKVLITENLTVYKNILDSNGAINQNSNITLVSGSAKPGGVLDFTLDRLSRESGAFVQLKKGQKITNELLNREVIFPVRTIDTALNSVSSLDVIIGRPFVKHLPDAFYYPLLEYKEKVEFFLTPDYQKPLKLIFFTQKRLLESERLLSEKKLEFRRAIKNYLKSLEAATSEIEKIPEGQLDTVDNITMKIATAEEKDTLEKMLLGVSDEDGEVKGLLTQGIEKIVDFRKKMGFDSYYVYKKDDLTTLNPYIYQFLVSNQTSAEIIINIPNPELFNISNPGEMKMFIDGEEKEVVVKEISPGIYTAGGIKFKQGIHEISIPVPIKRDVIQTSNFARSNGSVEIDKQNNNLIKLTTAVQNSWVEYPLVDYNPDKTYVFGFFYRVIRGASPHVQVWQDSDVPEDNEAPKIRKYLPENLYDWKYIEYSISSNHNVSIKLERNATKPIIRIFTPFWNNCEGRNYRNIKLCKDSEFRKIYDGPTVVEIKNLKIRESFTGTVMLDNKLGKDYKQSDLKFKKISPVEYEVEAGVETPQSLLILNEGFHSGWKLFPESSEKGISEDKHYLANGYANGWLIDKPGKHTYKIKFISQEYFHVGIGISLIAVVSIIIIIIRGVLIKK